MTLFQEACTLDPGPRRTFLEETCRGDAALRREVEAMLAHDAAADGILGRTAVGGGMQLLASQIARTEAGATDVEGGEAVPLRIGRYRIIGKIGEGGMGTVFEAEQEQPRRTVALKVMRRGITSRQMLKRFEYEAHVLGQLHHPGIAQIYEAGMAESVGGDTGVQAFLAMELIRGLSLIQYADGGRVEAQRSGANDGGASGDGLLPARAPKPREDKTNPLGTRDRLELMAKICDAVQHAHQKGVIHRDLKPSNILVDETGQPKILDFGVARATGSDLQLTTLRTDVGQLIGTLPYMSPEQVAGHPDEVDTRSDVYALGVILYQLLSGRMPYDLASKPIPEAARVIRDERPARLSSISRVFRGDVDTIVSKALEKERSRRYQSAAELGADVRRYLAGEPIEARRDSSMYVLRTQLRRYRGFVAAAAIFVFLLMALAVYASVQARRNRLLAQAETSAKQDALDAAEQARRARDEAQIARDRADRNAQDLALELTASRIEAGRALSLAGNVRLAEDRIWAELMRNPDSLHARWALWEIYSRNPCLATLTGSRSRVGALAFNSTGTLLAVAKDDRTVSLWDVSERKRVATVADRAASLSIAFSPDDRFIAGGCNDGNVRIWPTQGADESTCPQLLTRHRAGVPSVCFSPDGRTLVSGSYDKTIGVWDFPSGAFRMSLTGHGDWVTSVAFSPDGRVLYSSSSDLSVRAWDAVTGDPIWVNADVHVPQTRNTRQNIIKLVAGHDGDFIATGGGDDRVRLWEAGSGAMLATMAPDKSPGWCLALDPLALTLVTGWSWGIDLWDTRTAAQIHRYGGHKRQIATIQALAYSPNGSLFASGSLDGTVKLWEPRPNLCRTQLAGHTSWVFGTSFSPDGTMLATCGGDSNIKLWDVARRECVHTIVGHKGRIRPVVFSPDGKTLASGGEDRIVRLWDASSHECVLTLSEHKGEVYSIAFSPDAHTLATAGSDGLLKLWELPSGRCLATESIGQIVYTVRFSPDGRWLACTGKNASVVVSDARDLSRRAVFGEKALWSLAFSPDGKLLAGGTWEGPIDIWAMEEGQGKRVATLTGHDYLIPGLTFSPDGRILASASSDSQIVLWDVSPQANGTLASRWLATLEGHTGEVPAVAFSPDQRFLVSGGQDQMACLWDLSYYARHIAGNQDYWQDQANRRPK